MSGFLCVLDRSGAALDRRAVDRLAEPLHIYGGGLSTFCQGPLGIAVRHGEAPAAREGFGPSQDPETGLVVAAAGRFAPIDRQPSLESAACGPGDPGAAAWMRAVCSQRDLALLARISGSFALIAGDPARCSMSVARDHLGDHKLYYYLDRRWFLAASEPAALLRHEAVSDDLDEGTVARFLGFRFSHSERSFFRQVRELPPAHRLEVTAGESRREQYWRFRRLEGESRRPEEEIRAGFVAHLRRSVALQTEGLEPSQVALSLSGGLDSPALAALAPRGIRAFSWYFDEVPEGDERPHLEAITASLGMPIRWVRGDGLYPLSGEFTDRFVHENSPYVNAFAALKHELYQAARAEGCTRVMVGDGGDSLYAAEDYWLRDSLADRRPGALASLAGAARGALRGQAVARAALRRLMPLFAVRGAYRRRRPSWLTPAGRALLPPFAPSPTLPASRRQSRFELSAGARPTELESEERRLFAQCGVERSNPFWYWPLLEMVSHLPAYWLRQDGTSKVLTREALAGMLPQRVLASGRIGLLGAFFLRGIELHRDEIRRTVFHRPRSDWQRYVERRWVEPYLDATGSAQLGHTILWRVISYELWQRRLIGARSPQARHGLEL
jgi:asparagine synthase (glutamine-hydrolysing)